MAAPNALTSPLKAKQPLAQRSTNIPSPIKSPSKIALPPSPISSPTMTAATKRTTKATHTRSFSQDMMEPVIEDPMSKANIEQKSDLVRKIAEAHLTGQTYVSPSDDIFSPTTKKLNEVKAKRFGNFKNKKSSLYNAQMLFSSPSTKSAGAKESTGPESRT